MELKKYIIIIIFLNLTSFLHADIIQPAKNLTAYDVVKIQLSALKNNSKQSKNDGIKQTWIFAHPENKKYTGPYERFEKMILSNQYKILLNHVSHKINLITNSEDNYIYNILPNNSSPLSKILAKEERIIGKIIEYQNKKWVIKKDSTQSNLRTIKIKNGNQIKTISYNQQTNEIKVDNKAIKDSLVVSDSSPSTIRTVNVSENDEKKDVVIRQYDLPSIITTKKKKSKTPIVITAKKIKARLMFGANSLKSQKIYAKQIADNTTKLTGSTFIGSIAGYNMDRLDINFHKIKLKDGREFSISAHAVGIDNAPGIRGKLSNNIGTNAAKSIASTAIDFSGGHMLGSALDSALDPTLEQNDKKVVSVKKGVEFYVFFDEDFQI